MAKTELEKEGAAYVRVETPRAANAKKTGLEPAVDGDRPSPLDSAGWLSRVTLWWVNPLIIKGYASPLLETDVWKLPAPDGAVVLQNAFDDFYAQEKRRVGATDKPTPIARPLWRATKAKMALAIVLHVASASLSMVQPLLVKAVLQFLQGKGNYFGISSGYTLAALLVCATFMSISTLDYGMFLTTRAGLNARMIVVNSVYQKILKLTTTARQSMNSGDIITLAGVDSERLFEAYAIGMWTVVSPFMVFTVCVLIGIEMGAYVALAAGACSTFMIALCLFVYVYKGNVLDVPTTFTLLAFANVCRMPFGIFSNAVVFTSEAIASMQRIAKFLAADEIEAKDGETANFHDDAAAIEIRDGDFSWAGAVAAASGDKFGDDPQSAEAAAAAAAAAHPKLILSNINLSIQTGSLTIVVVS
ncbi:hypothetical protein PybrP1_009036 [[Pythium] brassicae (nom. inval.)]|nr:hypothetical protein PybrP1_009036 [[Pythium] brassicae (nom. inval.)]